ncbi:MAG: DUF6955 family protein [Desulfotomaculales bacterium]
MADVFPINIWINEERYEKLKEAGLADMTKEVLAGLKVIQVPCNAEQRDQLLAMYPGSKCDTATTKTIELLPKDVKDKIFDLIVANKSVDVIAQFLASVKA